MRSTTSSRRCCAVAKRRAIASSPSRPRCRSSRRSRSRADAGDAENRTGAAGPAAARGSRSLETRPRCPPPTRCLGARPRLSLARTRLAASPAALSSLKNAPMLRAVLWDLDGTLTDSVRFVVDTANRVIEAHGGSALAFESVGAMTGLPLEEIFRMAWPDLTPDLAQRYRTEYRDIYDREIIPATKLFDGARE